MKVSESGQELLERMWMASEDGQAVLASEGVPAEEAEELSQKGLVQRDEGLLTLTTAGRSEAAQAIRRRRLAERLLADVLVTEETLLDEQACRLEHALLDGLDSSICTLLGHPQFCPHGKPIPPGECCRQARQSVSRLIAPLSDLQPEQRGQIAYIRMSDPQRAQKLMAMGVLPGVQIRLLRRFPSFVFDAGLSQFAVDEGIAEDVYVRLAAEPE